MDRVVLLRHAKSSWSDPRLEDHARPLSKRGVADARRMARFIERSEGVGVDLVLCSSALRARQTWAYVEERVSPRYGARVLSELYLPTTDVLFRCLARVSTRAKGVMIVGHNPSLEAFALALSRGSDSPPRARLMERFPTAGLCVIELSKGRSPERAHVGRGRVALFVTPKELASTKGPERAPIKALPIELGRRPRFRGTALRVFEAGSDQLRANMEGARRGEDPEYVHQMRVAIRRLRTALRFFRGVLPGQASDALRAELRWLFGLLGPVREYDVALAQVLPTLEPEKGLVLLRKELEEARLTHLARLAAALDSARYGRLLSALLEQQAALAQLEPQAESAKLKPRARKRLEKILRRVERLHPAVDAWLESGADPRSSKVQTLHALRKELKKLRYASDFVQDAFPKRARRKYLRRLSALQDVLGELQDRDVNEGLLSRHLKAVPERAGRGRIRAQVQATLTARASAAVDVLGEAFRDFEKTKPFWR